MAQSSDAELFDLAVAEHRTVVTENAKDFIRLLKLRLDNRAPSAVIVCIFRRSLPVSGALGPALARRLHDWAMMNTDPNPGPHWP